MEVCLEAVREDRTPVQISSDIHFLKHNDTFDKEKPFAFRYDVGDPDIPQTNMEMEPRPCILRNIRGIEHRFSLEKHGFEVQKIGDSIPYERFSDETAVKLYFHKLEDMLKSRLGASSVQAFRHGIRKRHPDFPVSTGEKYDFDQPTSVAHIDTTPEEMEEYVTRLSEDTGLSRRRMRWQWINVWKPLRGPLTDWPLAFCDSSNLDPLADIEAADLLYPDLATENFQVYHNNKYYWYFLGGQEVSEVIVFLQADNGPNSRVGVPHCSFFNPFVSEGEPPRESIEVRLLACYG